MFTVQYNKKKKSFESHCFTKRHYQQSQVHFVQLGKALSLYILLSMNIGKLPVVVSTSHKTHYLDFYDFHKAHTGFFMQNAA